MREQSRPGLEKISARKLPATKAPPVLVPPPPLKPAAGTPPLSERPSLIAGIPAASMRAVAAALPLAPAGDSGNDEVRFNDVPEEEAVEIDVDDLLPTEEMQMPPAGMVDAHHAVSEPKAERLALMTAATLFTEVSREALTELSNAAVLMELEEGAPIFAKDSACDALYLIALGTARVILPHVPTGGVDLTEGQVFGEGCLLEGGRRQADVEAKGQRNAPAHRKRARSTRSSRGMSEVGNVLFDLLVQRLIANVLQSSPLFSAFDSPTRRELARLFEVRRAAPGTAITELGKRADGLYVALAGSIERQDARGTQPLELGMAFGQEALLARAPSPATVRLRGRSRPLADARGLVRYPRDGLSARARAPRRAPRRARRLTLARIDTPAIAQLARRRDPLSQFGAFPGSARVLHRGGDSRLRWAVARGEDGNGRTTGEVVERRRPRITR